MLLLSVALIVNLTSPDVYEVFASDSSSTTKLFTTGLSSTVKALFRLILFPVTVVVASAVKLSPVSKMTDFTSAFVSCGLLLMIAPANPETYGVAIDVPDIKSYVSVVPSETWSMVTFKSLSMQPE